MSDAPNFSSILDKPFDAEANRPIPVPPGTYLCIVDGIPKFDKTKSSDPTDVVEFALKPVQAQEDVDQTALQEALKGGSLSDVKLRVSFYLTEKAVYRLDEFLENLGLDKGSVSRKEGVSMAPSRQVLATVIHAASKDGKAIYANVGSTARV